MSPKIIKLCIYFVLVKDFKFWNFILTGFITGPAERISLPCHFDYRITVFKNVYVFSSAFFHRSNVLQAWMFVLAIIPVDKISKPNSCVFYIFKMMRIAACIFQCFEKRFDVRIVVAYLRTWKTNFSSGIKNGGESILLFIVLFYRFSI